MLGNFWLWLRILSKSKDKQLILAGAKAMARGDVPGELKLKLTKMITAMPTKG